MFLSFWFISSSFLGWAENFCSFPFSISFCFESWIWGFLFLVIDGFLFFDRLCSWEFDFGEVLKIQNFPGMFLEKTDSLIFLLFHFFCLNVGMGFVGFASMFIALGWARALINLLHIWDFFLIGPKLSWVKKKKWFYLIHDLGFSGLWLILGIGMIGFWWIWLGFVNFCKILILFSVFCRVTVLGWFDDVWDGLFCWD